MDRSDIKECDLHEYTSSSSPGEVLEFDLEYPKEFRELYNDNPLALYKIEIKREMLIYRLPIKNC